MTMHASEIRVRRVARRAIFLINRDGWAQARSRADGRGGWCAMHALFAADADFAFNVRVRAEFILRKDGSLRSWGGRKKPLARWNDRKGRTKAEVIHLLRRVARGERGAP